MALLGGSRAGALAGCGAEPREENFGKFSSKLANFGRSLMHRIHRTNTQMSDSITLQSKIEWRAKITQYSDQCHTLTA